MKMYYLVESGYKTNIYRMKPVLQKVCVKICIEKDSKEIHKNLNNDYL